MQFEIPEILAQATLTTSNSGGSKDHAKNHEWVFYPGTPKAGQGKGRFLEPLFSEKLKDLIKERGELHEMDLAEEEPVISISVPLSEGGNQTAVWLGQGTSVFDVHSGLRKCFADAVSEFRKKDGAKLTVDVSELSEEEASVICEALGFLGVTGGWKPFRFGQRQKKATKSQETFQAALKTGKLNGQSLMEDFRRGAVLGRANNRVRTLADLPANCLNPVAYRAYLEKECKRLGLGFEFMGTDTLKKMGAGAFLAVVQADLSRGAGIAKITYRPKGTAKGAKAGAPLALVGKGVCFDTGGYNIKPGQYMLGMHGDMTGSALSFALIVALAEMGVDFEVNSYLAIAENLISASAYKPNEVVIAMDGTAIEVVDTDAEGRMILSDTLALARKSKPWLMLDFATLTGAAIRALDTRRCAVFSHDAGLAEKTVWAGEASGERVWSFPLSSDYRRELKSKVGDILQCAASHSADHIYAATFLSHFAGRETPWVHIDLVAAENKGGLGLVASDTTGFGVLLSYKLITSLEPRAAGPAKPLPKQKRTS